MGQPTQQRTTRRTVLAVAAAVLVVAVVAVVVTLLVRQGQSAGAGSLTAYPADRADRAPAADPTREVDTRNYRDSVGFATDFVGALVRRDSTVAYGALCASARSDYPDAAALQARFDQVAGGRVTTADYDTVFGDGPLRDDVVFSLALAGGGGRGSLTVVVDDDGGQLAACGLQGGSAAPTY